MGIFDKLFGKDKSEDSKKFSFQVARSVKKITNPNQQPAERKFAIQSLAQLGTDEAAKALVLRFGMRAEQSIVDEEEKKMAADALIGMGEKSIAPVQEFIRHETSLYWPIRTLAGIIGKETTVDFLLQEIEDCEAIFERDVLRKMELISNLNQFDDTRVPDTLKKVLDEEENEEIKARAIEGLGDIADKDMIKYFIDRLVNPRETQRIRNVLLQIAVDKKWKMKYRRDEIKPLLPATYWIDDVGIIRRK